MNKEQILMSLKDIRSQLPASIKSSDSNGVTDNLVDQLVDSELGDNAITSELEKVNEELDTAVSNFEASLDMIRIYNESIANAKRQNINYQTILKHYQDMLVSATGSNKEDLEKKVDEYNTLLLASENEQKRFEEELKQLQQSTNELEAITYDKMALANESWIKNQTQREEIEKKYQLTIASAKDDASLSYQGIAGYLDDLIDDFEKGNLTEEEVNFRVQTVRRNLNKNSLIKIYEENEEQLVTKRLPELNEEIAKLEAKISDASNYMMSEDEYNSRVTDIKEKLSRLRKNDNEHVKRILYNNEQISKIDEELADSSITDERRQQLLNNRAAIEKRNNGINDNHNKKIAEIARLDSELTDLNNNHNKVNKNALNKDKRHLRNLKAERDNIDSLSETHRKSLDERIITLLIGTGSKPEEFVDNKPENKPNAVDDNSENIPDLSAEDLGNRPVDESTPDLSRENIGDRPAEIEEFPIIEDTDIGERPYFPEANFDDVFPIIDDIDIGERPVLPDMENDKEPIIPITGVKKPKPKLLERIRANWKKYVIPALAALLLACGVKSCVAQPNDTKDPVPTIPIEDVIKDEPEQKDPTPNTPDPTPNTPDSTPNTPDPTPNTPDPLPETPINPDEVHDNSNGDIFLADGDFVLNQSGATIDSDGIQRDSSGQEIGEVDLEHTPGGYAVVEKEDIPQQQATPEVTNVEGADFDTFSQAEQEQIAREVGIDLSTGEVGLEDDIDWGEYDFTSQPQP